MRRLLRSRNSTPGPNRGPVYYGWYIVAVLFLVGFVKAGFTGFLFSVFLKPMSEDFGWTRSATVGAVTIGTLGAAVFGAVLGPYLDRYGPRFLVSGAALLMGASAIAVSRVSSLWTFYLFYFVGRAMSQSILGDTLTAAIVSKWFIRRRGTALALTTMGLAMGGLILALLVQAIISRYGWREGWIALGLLAWGLTVLPALLFLRRTPEDMGLLPDGAPRVPTDLTSENLSTVASPPAPGAEGAEHSWTRSEAVRTKAYWLLATILALSTLNGTAVTFHMVPYLTDIGISGSIAVAVLGTYAMMLALSLPVWGIVADRIGVQTTALLGAAITFCGVALLLVGKPIFVAFLAAVAIGIGSGGFHLAMNLLWASYFGRHYLGAIMGLALVCQMGGNSLGPITAALIFDLRNSYIIAFAGVLVLQGLVSCMLLITRPPVRKTSALPSA